MKKILKNNYAWAIIIFLSIVPVFLWFISPSFSPRFNNLTSITYSFGKIAGLVGMALFSINLILSSRFKFLDKYFKGLNNVYAKHSLIGQFAFILLLFHPLLLAVKYSANSFYGAALFLSFGSDWSKNWGWLSLVSMIILIVLTLYLRPKYNLWKITHKFMGLSFFFASLHIFLIPSDVSRFLPLKIYMLTLAFLGLAVFVYRTLLGKYLVRKYKYLIENVERLNENIVEITMKPKNKKLTFKPGQFVFVSFLDSKISKESHPFSISSGPNDDNLKITVKNLGDYTNDLVNLSSGSMAEIEGPYGFFSYQNSIYNNQIWIAGGIGITPFLSMAKALKSNNDYNIDLFYCFNNYQEPIYLDWLESFDDNLKVHPFSYDQKGYINADAIKNISGNLAERDIFICAPPAMIKSLKNQLITYGVDKKLIHSEEFNF